ARGWTEGLLRAPLRHLRRRLQDPRRRRARRVRHRAGSEGTGRRERDEVGPLNHTLPAVEAANWRRAVEPYVGPNARRASFQLVTTLLPLALAVAAAHVIRPHSTTLALLLVPLIAGLIVRTFIL